MALDKVDLKILAAIDKDPRVSTTKIAKYALVSQQVADYRVKRLRSSKTINKFGTLINLNALGFEHYRMFFKFNANKGAVYSDLLVYLKRRKGIYWAARTGGQYDLLIVLFVKDFEALELFLDELHHAFPGLIKESWSCYATEHRSYRHKYISGHHSAIIYKCTDERLVIDKLDWRILHSMKDDCRISSLVLGQEAGVSYKTILNRIAALERKRIILGYRMFLMTPEKRPYVVLLSFKNYSKRLENALLAHLDVETDVTQTVRLFGVWNTYIHIRSSGAEALQAFVITLRDKFDIVDKFEIIPIFEDISINLLPV